MQKSQICRYNFSKKVAWGKVLKMVVCLAPVVQRPQSFLISAQTLDLVNGGPNVSTNHVHYRPTIPTEQSKQ